MSSDEEDIHAVILRQFQSLTWNAEKEGDWLQFADDFLKGAPLYGAARPAISQSVSDFVGRMKGLSQSSLPSLDERLLGYKVHAFGNIAVALSVCELNENNEKTTRNVEAMLLIKDSGRWRIAAQAWDTETEAKPIPWDLMQHSP